MRFLHLQRISPRRIFSQRTIWFATATLLLLIVGALSISPWGQVTPVVQAQGGVIWSGIVYNGTAFESGTVIAQGINVSPLSFNNAIVTTGGQTVQTPATDWSARFTTNQNFADGFYQFNVQYNDGVRVTATSLQTNQQEVLVDALGGTGFNTATPVLAVVGAQTVTIQVEYIQRTVPAQLSVTWTQFSGTPQPTGTTPPLATGTVEQVRGLAVRTGPYLGASLVGVARPENTYPVLARNDSEGLFTWYKIVLDEDTIGWSSGRYLALEGNIDALPFESTVFDTLTDPPTTGITGATRAVMNLRVRPSERATRLAQIPWGDEVPLLARTVQGGQDFWYLVRYKDPNRPESEPALLGWIYAPFITVRGPIEAVPIY